MTGIGITLTQHARERMEQRGINLAQIIYVLEEGQIWKRNTDGAGTITYEAFELCVVLAPDLSVITTYWRT